MVATITVRITRNYGTRVVYPVCETAKKLATLIGTRTFTERALQQIRDLGYEIVVEPESLCRSPRCRRQRQAQRLAPVATTGVPT